MNTATGTTGTGTTLDTGNDAVLDTGIDTSTASEEANQGFISAQLHHYKQQLELANRTIAINRALLKKYNILQDHDPDFILKAFEHIDPGNNNNNTTTATGIGTGNSLTTTAAINGTGNSLTINTTGVPNPYSKRSSNGTNDTNGSNANPNNSIDLTEEEANQKQKAKPPTNLSKVIEPHSTALKKVIHEFKSTIQAATNHLATKQASLDKFSVPDYVVKSARMNFTLHKHKEISPLLQTDFDTLSQEAETILNRHQKELTTKVIQHLGLMVTNLNHLRVHIRLQEVSVLLLMHLAGTIHKTRSKSPLLSNPEAQEQTKYMLLKLLISNMNRKTLCYLIASKIAPSDTEIKTYTSNVILPLFEATYGAHKDSATADSPEDTLLVSNTVDTVMENLPHATVLHSENISQKILEAETAAAKQAIHARATTAATTAATAAALDTEDRPPNQQTVEQLIASRVAAETSHFRSSQSATNSKLDYLMKALCISVPGKTITAKHKPKTRAKASTKQVTKTSGSKCTKDSTTEARPSKRQKKVSFEPQTKSQPPTAATCGGRAEAEADTPTGLATGTATGTATAIVPNLQAGGTTTSPQAEATVVATAEAETAATEAEEATLAGVPTEEEEEAPTGARICPQHNFHSTAPHHLLPPKYPLHLQTTIRLCLQP